MYPRTQTEVLSTEFSSTKKKKKLSGIPAAVTITVSQSALGPRTERQVHNSAKMTS